MPDPLPRTVIREHSFERDLAALIADQREADDFVEAAEYILARDPKAGALLYPNGSVWFLPMAPAAGNEVILYYAFDDLYVWLFAIKATPF
jgi:hypothetical protein